MRSEQATAGVASQSDERDSPLFSVRDLEKYYPVSGGLSSRSTSHVKAVDSVPLDVYPGETLVIVGESDCGKTIFGKTTARLHESTGGPTSFDSREITDLDGRALRAPRRDIQVVYQDPSSPLNPRCCIGGIVKEPLVMHDVGTSTDRDERATDLLERVDLPVNFRHRYPNALSGDQQQRVATTRALTVEPKFVVPDKPINVLNVSVQAKVILLLDELQEELGLTCLMTSHDLSLVKNVANRIDVMYFGNFVEIADSHRLSESPRNPYVEQLLPAISVVESYEQDLKPDTAEVSGGTPGPADPPSGCPFNPCCCRAFDAYGAVNPELVEVEPGRLTRCLHDSGPKQNDIDAYLAEDQADREGMDGDRDQLVPLDGYGGCRTSRQEQSNCDRTETHPNDQHP